MGWSIDVLWSEALSCQLEYKYLAHLTGRKEYFDHVCEILVTLQSLTYMNALGRTYHGPNGSCQGQGWHVSH